MPDLMKTPSNRRYVVNFQNKEPKNKYDIWLSFNKHEQGNQVIVDSEYLDDKDLVFKVYMNGKWVPILGIPVSYEGIIQALEELDKKKMNLIKPTPLVDGHIPVIHQGSDECDQLIDGGDIATLIEEYITKYGFIPIARATTNHLGGIKADIHGNSIEDDQYVEAKFKGPEGPMENDRLYVSAAEIIQAIKIYIGSGGEGFDLQLMGPTTRGGAKANYTPLDWSINHFIPVLVRTVDEMLYVSIDDLVTKIIALLGSSLQIYQGGEGIDITGNTISIKTAEDNELGGVRARQIVKALGNVGAEISKGNGTIQDVVSGRVISNKHLLVGKSQIQALLTYNDDNSMFRDGFGIHAEPHQEYNPVTQEDEFYWTFNLEHTNPTDWGKVLQIKNDGSGIEWVPMSGGQTYDPLSVSSSLGDECVIVAPGPSGQSYFLRGDGVFAPIPSSGSTVSINPILNTGIPIAEYTIDNNSGYIYAPTSGSTYYPGDGILIDRNNYISIDTTNARDGWVLGYNSSIPGVEWVPQTSYTAGCGININNVEKKIEARIIESRSLIPSSATYLIGFRAISQSQTIRVGVNLFVDNANPVILEPYTYTNLRFTPDPLLSEYELVFELQDQPGVMYGNPVYCILQVDGKPDAITVKVNTTELSGNGLININEAVVHDVQNDRSKLNPYCNHYLITMQFGIVKIEPLEATIVSSNNNGGGGGGGNEEPAE